jgi:hypothetical protein
MEPEFHKSPSLVSIQNQMNPLNYFPPHVIKIHFNIVLWPILDSPKSSYPLKFLAKLCVHFLSLPIVLCSLPILFFLILPP